MHNVRAIVAVAGLAPTFMVSMAAEQHQAEGAEREAGEGPERPRSGVTLTFSADRTQVQIGEIFEWIVSASFTGHPDPSAYFGGFLGDFIISERQVAEIASFQNLMNGEGNPATAVGGSVHDINIFNSALLGTNDPSNPLDIFAFTTLATDLSAGIEYTAEGVVSMFPDDGIFTLAEQSPRFEIISDSVQVVPAPGAAAVLAALGLSAARPRRP